MRSLCIDPIYERPGCQALFDEIGLPWNDLSKQEEENSLYELEPGEVGVYLMPHCEKELYEFVVGVSNRSRIVIVGNSFKKYRKRKEESEGKVVGLSGSVEGLAEVCKEEALPRFGGNPYAFGDLAVIRF